MKKLLSLLVVVAFSLNTVNAQDARSVRFGLVASPGMSWLKSTKAGQDGEGVSIAFNYGLQMEFMMGDYFSIVTGVGQANFNAKVNYQENSVNLSYTNVVDGVEQPAQLSQVISRQYVFNSVEVPLKLKLKTPEIGYFTYFLEAGIANNINYKARTTENTILEAGTEKILTGSLEDIDVNDDTNWYRGATILDAGFEYTFVGNTALMVSVNWQNSFTNILNNEALNLSYISNGLSLKQGATLDYIGLTVGLLF